MNRLIAVLLSVSLAFSSAGCATLLRGTSQSVTVKTMPAGRSVVYQGRELADGEMVAIQKQFEPPRFHVGEFPVEMSHDPDPLLLGDAALLLFFVVPGLVALGIDFATGAWRNLHGTQVVPVPDSVANSGASGDGASHAGDGGAASAAAEAEQRAPRSPSSVDSETSSAPATTNGVVGHVHGHGCGHVFRNGRWVSIEIGVGF